MSWAIRLGGYLLYRIHLIGKDKRFDGLRDTLPKIFAFWFLQAFTVFVLLLPSIYFLQYNENMSFGVIWFGKNISLSAVI